MATQAAVGAQPDHDRDGAGDDAGLQPETFGQRQTDRRPGGPARQQIGQAPAGGSQQADSGEARKGMSNMPATIGSIGRSGPMKRPTSRLAMP